MFKNVKFWDNKYLTYIKLSHEIFLYVSSREGQKG